MKPGKKLGKESSRCGVVHVCTLKGATKSSGQGRTTVKGKANQYAGKMPVYSRKLTEDYS